MRVFSVLLATALMASPIVIGAPAPTKSPYLSVLEAEKRAVQLDKQSRVELGISIRALGLLLQVYGPEGRIFRKDSAINDGSWPQLVVLEKNGYAKLSTVTDIPDGSDARTEHVLVKLTDKGTGVAESLLGANFLGSKF